TTHAVVVGSAVRRDLIDVGIVTEERSTMIPPGIRDAAGGVIPDRCGVKHGSLLVGFIGRLTAIKRPDRFVDVARSLSSDRADVDFVIVGDGPLGDEVRSSSSALSNIQCVGWRRDIAPVLAALDVLVMCSDNEGIPLTLIEAAQHGVATVTTDVGSVRDIVDHERTGLVTETTVEALSDAVRRLVDDGALRSRLGAAARDHAQSSFGVVEAQRRHRELYRRLVKSR
ncbi:MAG: glycosyltransferase family 4 protein, partial [Actinomycetota bacterium]